MVTYDKTKIINVNETIDINKTVEINVTVNSTVGRAAEAEALINQNNTYNQACENCAEKRDIITGSLNDNDGIVDVNQAAGNMNNQGNAVSVSVDDRNIEPEAPGESPKEGQSYAQAQAANEQDNFYNMVDATNLIEKSALIQDSLNRNTGVVLANQAAGNMANQGNALAMAVGFGEGGVAIAESDLGQFNAFNVVNESGEETSDVPGEDGFIFKNATITNAINDNSGVIGVNQSAGNNGNQSNVVSFAVVIGATTPQ
jgi:hypothetical protein